MLPELTAAALLRDWDFRYDRESRGATVFELVYHAILARVFGDGLFGREAWRAIVEETTTMTDYFHLFDNAILGGDPSWFGGRGRDAVLREVLEQTLAAIDPATVPRWGATRRVMLTDIFFKCWLRTILRIVGTPCSRISPCWLRYPDRAGSQPCEQIPRT